ncbi:MAG: hypothetical protein ACTSX1_03715 [Candidatus Heimdallarchaeaceae archaeon]
MKIKTDFVTNSSTTSFVVIGNRISISEIKISTDIVDQITDDRVQFQQEIESPSDEYFDKLLRGTGLEFSYGESGSWGEHCEEVLIGVYYSDMKDEETLGQFKSRIQQLIKDAFGIDSQPYHIEEAWRDG